MNLACQQSSAFLCKQQTPIPGQTCPHYWKYQCVARDMSCFTYHKQTEGEDISNHSFVCIHKSSYTIRSPLQKEDADSKDTLLIFQKILEIESLKKSSCFHCTSNHCPLIAHTKINLCMQVVSTPAVAIIFKDHCIKLEKQTPNLSHK